MTREDSFVMWLLRISGINNTKAEKLIEYFGTAENVFGAEKSELAGVDGLTAADVSAILSARDMRLVERYVRELEEYSIEFISLYSDGYPKSLKNIRNRPVGLYMRGMLPLGLDERYCVSVIGARKCTDYGVKAANKIASELAAAKFIVVSGLARGIDGAAHEGALDMGGFTIAVLGNGLDYCYPAENTGLMERIIQTGCVLSEYPPKTRPSRMNFPARNRIVSGLSQSLVIAEASEHSGTSITASLAYEQGKTVFAVPGSIFSGYSTGTNRMIKEGANLITGGEDIVTELKLGHLAKTKKIPKSVNAPINKTEPSYDIDFSGLHTSDDETLVLGAVNSGARTAEEIIERLSESGKNLSAARVQACLTSLELYGCVARVSGSGYKTSH